MPGSVFVRGGGNCTQGGRNNGGENTRFGEGGSLAMESQSSSYLTRWRDGKVVFFTFSNELP
jgi:hypothetical protein